MRLITSLITVTPTDHAIQRCREIKNSCMPRGARTGRRMKRGRERIKKNGGSRSANPPGSPEKEHEKWGSRSRMLDGNPQRVKRRRATLPHPLECSTIAAPGLSYRVRNGTGRLTRAMTTANLTATARKPKESKPACHRWRFGNRLADARQTPIVVSFSDHPNAYCRPGRSSTGKTRNQPPIRGSECYVAVAR